MSTAALAEAPAERPTVIVDHEEGRVAREVLKVLPSIDALFKRGSRLVIVGRDSGEAVPDLIREAPAPAIAGLPKPLLRRWVADHCELVRQSRYDLMPVHPPNWLIDSVYEDGTWPGVRHLEAIVTSPMFVRGGRIVFEPGYDAKSGLYVTYDRGFQYTPVPERPTKRQTDAAAAELTDWLIDFMFERDEHRAAILASVFTYFARFAYKGGSPLFLLDANVPGPVKGS